MLKLHLVDLFSIRYTTMFAANTVTNRTNGVRRPLKVRQTARWSVVGIIDPS